MTPQFDERDIWKTDPPRIVWHWYVGGVTFAAGLMMWVFLLTR